MSFSPEQVSNTTHRDTKFYFLTSIALALALIRPIKQRLLLLVCYIRNNFVRSSLFLPLDLNECIFQMPGITYLRDVQ